MDIDKSERYILKRVQKVMKHVKGKLVVAVSGGKDSLVSSLVLKKIDIPHDLFHINLGIPKFSDESLTVVKQFARDNNLNLTVVNIEKYTTKKIPDLIPFVRRIYHKDKPCALCGLFKRYIMNRWAWENNYDYVITGHNLNDTAATIIMNINSQDINQLFRIGPVIKKREDIKMVGKVKPLYWVREDIISEYAKMNKIKVVQSRCPYSSNNVHLHRVKKALIEFEKVEKNFMTNLVKVFHKIKKNLKIEDEDVKVTPCKKCGFGTTTEICKFCRTVEKIQLLEGDN